MWIVKQHIIFEMTETPSSKMILSRKSTYRLYPWKVVLYKTHLYFHDSRRRDLHLLTQSTFCQPRDKSSTHEQRVGHDFNSFENISLFWKLINFQFQAPLKFTNFPQLGFSKLSKSQKPHFSEVEIGRLLNSPC